VRLLGLDLRLGMTSSFVPLFLPDATLANQVIPQVTPLRTAQTLRGEEAYR
jgi:hypothetical protein